MAHYIRVSPIRQAHFRKSLDRSPSLCYDTLTEVGPRLPPEPRLPAAYTRPTLLAPKAHSACARMHVPPAPFRNPEAFPCEGKVPSIARRMRFPPAGGRPPAPRDSPAPSPFTHRQVPTLLICHSIMRRASLREGGGSPQVRRREPAGADLSSFQIVGACSPQAAAAPVAA